MSGVWSRRSPLPGAVLSFTVAAVLPAAVSLVACGADPADGPPTPSSSASSPAPSPTGVGPAASSDAGEPPPPPCDPAQAAAVQASFERAAPDAIDAVALVKDPSCGARYFTRGPSKIPESALQILASNTKTHVASLILLLAEDGKLRLDDSASRWIPGLPGGDAIKIRHLLNHTSGLYNYTDSNFFMVASSLKTVYSPQDLLDISFDKALAFAPGESGKWEYSNTNYVLLGMIAEKVTGRPVEQLLRERILTPIGANETFFHGKEEIVGDIAPGRSFLGTNGATFMDPSASWCAGSYVGSMRDLVQWCELRGSGKFHSAKSQAAMLETVPTNDPHRRYGAGVSVFDATALHGNGPAIGHAGDLVGYHSYAFYFPEKKTTVAVMVNDDEGPSGSFPLAPTYRSELFLSVTDALFGDHRPPGEDGGAEAKTE